MCQVGEDYVEPPPREPPPVPRPGCGQKCVKCKQGDPVVVIRAGDAFCRDCFKAFYVHKFRAMLGKNRLIFPGEKVLLAWSGGPSSSSMVWQVLEVRPHHPQGLSQDSAKRLRFVPGVVYVDEGAACGQSPEDRAKTLAEVKQVLHVVNFPWHLVALEETEALCRLFESVRTLTAKEELLQTLRSHLILHVARAHGYSKVMTGDSCTRLAIKLMTNLALGRGAFLAWDTGFSDERHGDVVVVRPMRDHTLKEVAFYNRLFAVPLVFTPAVDTKAPEKASVHRLMEAFILRLQAQFPSTVSTVYRTGEKLVKAPRDGCGGGPSGPRCLLCLCTLDIDTADSATAFGAQTSSLSQMPPSTLQAEAGTPTAPCCAVGEGPGCCWKARGRTDDAQAQVTQQLCYGCRGNMSDLPSLDRLPPYILAEAQLRSQRAGVMQEIQEYLIEDSSDEAEGPQS
ncbi:cytoplasmic tRNA 2-thiolation protein 2 isoform X3 [Heterocephalus glaber]|uniref:Cytoplasmic tRNA 2-thiolation protein 2 n=1 Tax=Heterocephalus glaber TaxID=10181 RepID=A0AAX6SWH6_HETGA|nr:cytoplasmic tRNA 2-thiolation protein 2 isoform X3 [Heterocephalus glaber]